MLTPFQDRAPRYRFDVEAHATDSNGATWRQGGSMLTINGRAVEHRRLHLAAWMNLSLRVHPTLDHKSLCGTGTLILPAEMLRLGKRSRTARRITAPTPSPAY